MKNITDGKLKTESIIGYILIAGASLGFYQSRFFLLNAPEYFWISMALIGSIFIAIRDHHYYCKYHQLLFNYDMLFCIPAISIPLIPIRHDIALILMILYCAIYVSLFLHIKLKYVS